MKKNSDFTKIADGILKQLTLKEKADLVSGVDTWHTEPVERLGLKSVMMTDGPHGLRKELDDGYVLQKSEVATCFPTAAALGCSFDRELLSNVGKAIADEAKKTGVSCVLGPGINMKRNPLCGRNFEYFSEDPLLAGELASAFINGMQANEVAACVKHYALNDQEDKRFVSNSCADMRTIREIYLSAFERVVKKSSPEMLMSSYNLVNNEYVGESRLLIHDILRAEWGYDGMVVSDWTAVRDRVACLKAGLDLEMPGKTSGTTADILAAIESGQLREWELDDCVRRVLIFVLRHSGAVKQPGDDLLEVNRVKARAAAAGCCVLLKNDNSALPLKGGQKLAVIGLMAKQPRYQGAGSSLVNSYKVDSLCSELDANGMKYAYADGYTPEGETNETLLAEALRAADGSDAVVAVIGLPDSYESEGYDRKHMRLPDGMLKLIAQLELVSGNVIVVLQLGSPVELPFMDRVNAILCAYLGGQASGAGLFDVLTGRVNPSGRLAESWAKKQSDLPNGDWFAPKSKAVEYREGKYIGYRYYDAVGVRPAYAFGAGITYSSFALSGVRCDKASLRDGESAVVSLEVKNASSADGTETLLVFAARKDSRERRLVGFCKVPVTAGGKAAATVEIFADDLRDFDVRAGRFVLPHGGWTLTVSGTNASAELSLFTDGVPGELPEYIAPTLNMKTPNTLFYNLLGFVPSEPPVKPYTLNSTLYELRGTLAGKIVYAMVRKTLGSTAKEGSDETVGINDMPLRAVCAFSKGVMPRSMAEGIIALANGKFFKGVALIAGGKK